MSRLTYHPEWPALEQFSGNLLYHGNHLQGRLSSGQVGEVVVGGGTVTLDTEGDRRLNIVASGAATADSVYRTLTRSPLQELHQWPG